MAYCIGPALQSRPSAIFLIAASTSSIRSEPPTTIQPVRQPGARYAFDSDEKDMIAASGASEPRSGVGPSKATSLYTSSARIGMPAFSATAISWRRVASEYTAPVGLFGSITTSARVRAVMSRAMWSTSGCHPRAGSVR